MGMVEQDPVEQYVQQLVARGYLGNRSTACATVCRTTWWRQLQQAAAPAGAGLYEQYYQQYLHS